MRFIIASTGILLWLQSCSPKISTSIIEDNGTLRYSEKVTVISLDEEQPKNATVLGTVKISDTGFTTKCNYETVLDKAKLEARKVGGNAVKITEHKTPNFWSTCHRLEAKILRITE